MAAAFYNSLKQMIIRLKQRNMKKNKTKKKPKKQKHKFEDKLNMLPPVSSLISSVMKFWRIYNEKISRHSYEYCMTVVRQSSDSLEKTCEQLATIWREKKLSDIRMNLNLNSLLVTRQMTLFHQGVRVGEKLVP